MPVRTGKGFAGGLMMRAMGLERPLFPAPVAGFRVMTVATPGLATSAAETVAVTESTFPAVSVVTVVGMVVPFQCTTVFATKPLPITVNVKPVQVEPLQALIWEGEREVIEAPVLF